MLLKLGEADSARLLVSGIDLLIGSAGSDVVTFGTAGNTVLLRGIETLTGNAGTFEAALSSISPEVVNGEVRGRLRFTGAQPRGLRQNQRMSARILLDTRRNVLMVERGPFVELGGGNSAYVMDGSTAIKRPIRTGATSLNAVELLDGVQPGDRIVVSGSDQFGDAAQVRISGE